MNDRKTEKFESPPLYQSISWSRRTKITQKFLHEFTNKSEALNFNEYAHKMCALRANSFSSIILVWLVREFVVNFYQFTNQSNRIVEVIVRYNGGNLFGKTLFCSAFISLQIPPSIQSRICLWTYQNRNPRDYLKWAFLFHRRLKVH